MSKHEDRRVKGPAPQITAGMTEAGALALLRAELVGASGEETVNAVFAAMLSVCELSAEPLPTTPAPSGRLVSVPRR